MAELEAQQASKPRRFISDAEMAAIEAQSSAPQLSFGQRFGKNLEQALQVVPFVNEGAAAVRSVLPGYGSYADELAAIEQGQKDYAKQNRGSAIASNVIGALATAPFLPSAVGRRASVFAKLGQAAAEGAGYGALYGATEGTGSERLGNAARSAAVGSVFAPAVTLGLEGASRGLKKTGDQFLKAGMNVQRSDLQRAGKFMGKGSSAESPLLPALRLAQQKGIISAGDDVASTIQKNETAIDELGGQVTSLLKRADAAQTDVVIPDLSRTKAFIDSNPFQEAELKNQLQRRLETLNSKWDGSISGANGVKQQLYKIGYKNTTDSAGLDRAIASDLREYVESQAGKLLGPEEATAIKALNAEQGQHLTLRDLLQKNKAQEEMAGGVPKLLRRGIVSPLGGGVAGVLTYGLTGNPLTAAAAGLGALATTKTGQLAASKGSKFTGFLSESAESLATPLAGRIAPSVFAPSPTMQRSKESQQQTNTLRGQNQRHNERALQIEPTGGPQRGNLKDVSSNVPSPDFALLELTKQDLLKSPELQAFVLDSVKQVESSGGKDKRTSSAGAKGAFQILDGTGKEYHKKLGLKEKYDPKNEKQQEKIALAILLDYMDQTDGTLKGGLTAYHSGPRNYNEGTLGPVGRNYAENVVAHLTRRAG